MNRSYDDIKNVADYERLSIEDRDKKNFSLESESISSQRELIIDFCNMKKTGNYNFHLPIIKRIINKHFNNLIKNNKKA